MRKRRGLFHSTRVLLLLLLCLATVLATSSCSMSFLKEDRFDYNPNPDDPSNQTPSGNEGTTTPSLQGNPGQQPTQPPQGGTQGTNTTAPPQNPSNPSNPPQNPDDPDYIGTPGLSFTELDDGTYSVSVGMATAIENIVIPSTYKNKPVTQIAAKGFYRHKTLKSISIPEGIEIINKLAFSGCIALTGVTCPNSLQRIEAYAFSSCSSLTKNTVYVPDHVIIASNAFNGTMGNPNWSPSA